MSWRTPCNRCSLEQLTRQATASDLALTCLPNEDGSISVLVHKRDEAPHRELHFRAWLMKLPDECACDD
jgi:hypothetical protein